MPFWDEARQERVRKRIAKIKEAVKITSSLLQVGGMILGGLGLALFITGIFSSFQVSWSVSAMIFGFISYFLGYMIDIVMTTLILRREVKK